MTPELVIPTTHEWQRLVELRLTVIVDPMVVRTADLFFRDWSAPHDDVQLDLAKLAPALGANADSLAAFVDAFLLNDSLPVFDYTDTFNYGFDIGHRYLLDRFNRDEEVLVRVTVGYDARDAIRKRALDVIRRQDPLPLDLRGQILEDLAAYEYNWTLTLPVANEVATDVDPRQRDLLTSFVYGGLLFTGYAQQLGGEHILHARRARMYVRSALARDPWADNALESMLAPLMEIARETPPGVVRTLALPPLPTFLPWLIEQAGGGDATPMGILGKLLSLRHRREVSLYREWWRELRSDLARGVVTTATERELTAIKRDLRRRLGLDADRIATGGAVAAVMPSRNAPDEEEDATGLFLSNLSGDGHRKILTDLLLADRSAWALDRLVRNSFDAGLLNR